MFDRCEDAGWELIKPVGKWSPKMDTEKTPSHRRFTPSFCVSWLCKRHLRMPVIKVNDLCSFSQCCGCISNVPPNRTCKNLYNGFLGLLLVEKILQTLFGSPWIIPLEGRCMFFWAPGTHPGRKSPRLTKSHTATHRNSRMSGVSRHSGLSTNQSRSTLAFRSLRNFWVKRHTSKGMRNKQSWYVSLWNKSGSPVEVGRLSHYSQGFLHPWWCRISSINSIMSFF